MPCLKRNTYKINIYYSISFLILLDIFSHERQRDHERPMAFCDFEKSALESNETRLESDFLLK